MNKKHIAWMLAAIMLVHCAAGAKILGVSGYLSGPGNANANVRLYAYNAGTSSLDQVGTATADGLGRYATVLAISDALSSVDIRVFANNSVSGIESNGTTWRYSVPVPNSVEINVSMTTPLRLLLPANGSATNDTTPFFSWVAFMNSSYTFDLVIDTDSGFAPPIYRTVSGIAQLNHTINSSQPLPDNRYYWRINERIHGVLQRTTAAAWFDIDSTPPTIDSYNPGNYTWRSTSPVSVTITTNENSQCRYDTVANRSYSAKGSAMSGSGTAHTASLTLSAQGNNIFYVQCRDTVGNTMPSETAYYLRYDNVAPVPGTVTVEGGAAYTDSTTVNFVWSGFTDATSGIYRYFYSFSNNQGTTSGTASFSSPGILAGASQGTNTVYVWAEDNAGNIGNSASDSIIVDTLAPVLYAWTQTPEDLDETASTDLVITVRVNDTTWNASNPPQLRYQYNSEGYFSWQDMSLVSGNQYTGTVPMPPLGWGAYVGDWLHYQVSATDMLGHTTTETRSEFIDIDNNAPTLNTIDNQAVYEQQNLSFVVSATDLDNDVLVFTTDGNFSFIRINNTAARAWWVPGNNDVGTNYVLFTVSDGTETDSQTVVINVLPANDPPVLSPIGNLKAYLHVPFLHYIYGRDPDNENEYLFDNQVLIFDKVQPWRWFRIDSYFNVSNASYYGVINFTPLLSHRGRHNVTIYVTDGELIDAENVTFTVGYCGDLDAGGEPWCDPDFETCLTCPQDCGPCSATAGRHMAIIIDPRNCLGRNFTITTYELYERATCKTQGLIVQGREVCGNLSNTKVDIFLLERGSWVKIDEFISDSNGEITYITNVKGDYKLVATKRDYPQAFQYLTISECHADDVSDDEPKAKEPELPPDTDQPARINRTEPPPEDDTVAETSVFSIILWYVIIPALAVMLIVLGYYYYDKEKNRAIWLLKTRIWAVKQSKRLTAESRAKCKRLREYLGYDK